VFFLDFPNLPYFSSSNQPISFNFEPTNPSIPNYVSCFSPEATTDTPIIFFLVSTAIQNSTAHSCRTYSLYDPPIP